MEITPRQLETVIALDGPKRYEHFLKVAADQRKVWGLYAEGWALSATDDGTELFPVWPAKEYAQICATGAWANFRPRMICLDDLFEELLPRLKNSGKALAVFYTPQDRGVIPRLSQFESDLRDELAKIE